MNVQQRREDIGRLDEELRSRRPIIEAPELGAVDRILDPVVTVLALDRQAEGRLVGDRQIDHALYDS